MGDDGFHMRGALAPLRRDLLRKYAPTPHAGLWPRNAPNRHHSVLHSEYFSQLFCHARNVSKCVL